MKHNRTLGDESEMSLLKDDAIQCLQKLSSTIKDELRALEDAPDDLETKFKGLSTDLGSDKVQEVSVSLNQVYSGYNQRLSTLQHWISSAEGHLGSLTSNKVYWVKMIEKYDNERRSLEFSLSRKYNMISQILKEKHDRFDVLGGSSDELRPRGKAVSNLVQEKQIIDESNRMTQEAIETGGRILESFQRQNEYMMVGLKLTCRGSETVSRTSGTTSTRADCWLLGPSTEAVKITS